MSQFTRRSQRKTYTDSNIAQIIKLIPKSPENIKMYIYLRVDQNHQLLHDCYLQKKIMYALLVLERFLFVPGLGGMTNMTFIVMLMLFPIQHTVIRTCINLSIVKPQVL